MLVGDLTGDDKGGACQERFGVTGRDEEPAWPEK